MKFNYLSMAIISLTVSSHALAAKPLQISEDNDWYRVDLVVFAQGKHNGYEDERWAIPNNLNVPSNGQYLITAAQAVDQLYPNLSKPADLAKITAQYNLRYPPATSELTENPSSVVDHFDALQPADDEDGVSLSDLSSPEDKADSHDENSTVPSPYEVYLSTQSLVSPAVVETEKRRYISPRVQSEITAWHKYLDKLLPEPKVSTLTPQWQVQILNEFHAVKRQALINLVNEFVEYITIEGKPHFSPAKFKQRGYRVLTTMTWHQYIPSFSQGAVVYIDGGATMGPYRELQGSIKIDRKRYLYTQLNQWFGKYSERNIDDTTPYIPTMPSYYHDTKPAAFDGLSELQWQPDEIWQQNKVVRMKSGESYYVDHPLMGSLLYVTKENDRRREVLTSLGILAKP